MFAGELKARAKKLEDEQRQRTDRERQRQEREKQAAERHRQRLKDVEDEQTRRRVEQQAAELAEQHRVEQETERNRGVYLTAQLQAMPLDPALAQSKGIRRAGDKMLLPGSMSHALMGQGAAGNGALLFEVKTASGRSTHAGVLEFSAPEGTVSLPPKVAACLWGTDATAAAASASAEDSGASTSGTHAYDVSGLVTVSYRRLERGTFVRFQPLSRGFHTEVGGDDVREVLERALHNFSALSEGDVLGVEHGGTVYQLKVQELQPERQVSIIDTDIEAEVVPSLETERYLRRMEQDLRERDEQMRRLQRQQAELALQVVEQAQRQAAEAAAVAAAEAAAAAVAAAAQAVARSAAAAALPAEPSPGHVAAACLFRLPDGSRASRRFALDAPVRQLFDFADAQGAGGLAPRTYALVTQFPRRAIAPDAAGTLQDVGLKAGQEAFLLEPLVGR